MRVSGTDARRAFSLSFGDEGAVGMMMGIMASCFLSKGRWLLCALAEGHCRRGNVVPLPPSFQSLSPSEIRLVSVYT